MLQHAQWIWRDDREDTPNQYVEFKQDFLLDRSSIQTMELHIAADSNYVAYLNGNYVASGQYHDFPDAKVYDTIPLPAELFREGENTLTVTVHYQGVVSFQYVAGRAGLLFELSADGVSVAGGPDTLCRQSPVYISGGQDRTTVQLGFAFAADASRPEEPWQAACVRVEGMCGLGDMRPRPIKKLEDGGRVPARITAQGYLERKEQTGSVAKAMQEDYLSAARFAEMFGDSDRVLPSEGGVQCAGDTYVVVDLGREYAGVLELEVEAQAGTVLDIAHGEHLDDLRVRAHVGGRNFAGRYVCKKGRQCFTEWLRRIAGRYMAIHITHAARPVRLHYVGMRRTEYPLVHYDAFCSNDCLQNKIYNTSVRTLSLCMHEHYEDCPWREQAMYTMDSRNQALCGYYCFGEYQFPGASFALFERAYRTDGHFPLCVPSEAAQVIPVFSFMWIVDVGEYVLYSGDIEAARRHLPLIKKMVAHHASKCKDGLMPTEQGADYWHFYEWSDGLDGLDGPRIQTGEGRLDAPLQLFWCLALQWASRLAGWAGDAEGATELARLTQNVVDAVHRTFWNEEKKRYYSYQRDGKGFHYGELTQALALYAGVCPTEQQGYVRQQLADKANDMVKISFSHSIFKYEALLQDVRYAQYVLDDISDKWGGMLCQGATTFWETVVGAGDFADGGSLCHGWSAIPVYLYCAYYLGIKPVEPGFEKVTCSPLMTEFNRFCGTVPTPHGPISVQVENINGTQNKHVELPDGVELQ